MALGRWRSRVLDLFDGRIHRRLSPSKSYRRYLHSFSICQMVCRLVAQVGQLTLVLVLVRVRVRVAAPFSSLVLAKPAGAVDAVWLLAGFLSFADTCRMPLRRCRKSLDFGKARGAPPRCLQG